MILQDFAALICTHSKSTPFIVVRGNEILQNSDI